MFNGFNGFKGTSVGFSMISGLETSPPKFWRRPIGKGKAPSCPAKGSNSESKWWPVALESGDDHQEMVQIFQRCPKSFWLFPDCCVVFAKLFGKIVSGLLRCFRQTFRLSAFYFRAKRCLESGSSIYLECVYHHLSQCCFSVEFIWFYMMSSYFRCQKPSYFTWAHHEKSHGRVRLEWWQCQRSLDQAPSKWRWTPCRDRPQGPHRPRGLHRSRGLQELPEAQGPWPVSTVDWSML